MKALTLTQPWATLVAIGAKRIETRSWYTKYRGPLLIHASQSPPNSARQLCRREPFLSALAGIDQLPSGILAKVYLLDCVPIKHSHSDDLRMLFDWRFDEQLKTWEQEIAFGDYSSGRFAFFPTETKKFESPIPAKGALGLWNFDFPAATP